LTPLHVTAHCGNVRAAKLLLDRKCEVNARALVCRFRPSQLHISPVIIVVNLHLHINCILDGISNADAP